MKKENVTYDLKKIVETLSKEQNHSTSEQIEKLRKKRMEILKQDEPDLEIIFDELYNEIRDKLSKIPCKDINLKFCDWLCERSKEDKNEINNS